MKEVRDGRKIEFDVDTTVELYLIILLGDSDTAWVRCGAIGKKIMAGQHCNHHQRQAMDCQKTHGTVASGYCHLLLLQND
jgi:hypothetical protein